MKIKKFADSKTVYEGNYPAKKQNYKHWVELEDGTKQDCSGNLCENLWHKWVIMEGVTREDNDDWTIFVFPEPYCL